MPRVKSYTLNNIVLIEQIYLYFYIFSFLVEKKARCSTIADKEKKVEICCMKLLSLDAENYIYYWPQGIVLQVFHYFHCMLHVTYLYKAAAECKTNNNWSVIWSDTGFSVLCVLSSKRNLVVQLYSTWFSYTWETSIKLAQKP